MRVGVLGAKGRVGSEVCRAVEEAPDTTLLAASNVRINAEKKEKDAQLHIADLGHHHGLGRRRGVPNPRKGTRREVLRSHRGGLTRANRGL